MDDRLQKRLEKWHKAIDSIKDIEAEYNQLDGSEKSLLAALTLAAEGKSFAEREAMARASEDFKKFKRGLSEAKTAYNHARRKLELLIKAFDAEYLTYKVETQAFTRSAG